MSAVKITSSNSKEFLEANKEAFLVLIFDAQFTGQQDIVDESVKSLVGSPEVKDKIVLGTVDVEENNDLATELSVLSVPTVVCLMKGKTVKKIDTLEPRKLVKIVEEELKKLALLSATDSISQSDPKEQFKEYLKRLVSRAPVMIFMKGEPKAPRCGFSKQLVEILAKHNISYETFDILQDENVRQGLKEFSDWPTYPQIYAKGEFVGGLDILKQLEETDELEATLKV